MDTLRKMPTFEPDGNALLGRMSYRASDAFEHGQMLAVRVHCNLATLALQLQASS